MAWSLIPSMAAGRAAAALGRSLGDRLADSLSLSAKGRGHARTACGAVLGALASAAVSAVLLDPVGMAGGVAAATADPGPGPDQHSDGEPKFGWEGRYPAGVDGDGNTVVQSSTGGPVVQATNEPADPTDITWP
ncbi:hypothetical protein ABZ611_19005 [Streptomyces sp. NPDC007861]|uniref:hypothetical protein n=1 Tax=Streptomyces sp. NPDC007861 TaxID=3154893 RepID=UPI0033ED6D68